MRQPPAHHPGEASRGAPGAASPQPRDPRGAPRAALVRWLWSGQWRTHPGRLATAVVAIAIGIALALAIQVVNRSALAEFGAAIAVVNGEAQARVLARADTLSEEVYPRVARHPMVAHASPVIETTIDAFVPGAARAPARIPLIGLDVFRAAEVTPSLLPSGGGSGTASSLFADDAVFLSRAALAATGASVGDALMVRAGPREVRLRVAGTLEFAAPGQRLAVMDIGAAQWRLGWLGRITRIDLRLAPGAEPQALARELAPILGPTATVAGADASRLRMSNLSRAYRVNLAVLALVALFTGGFIVHATIALAVSRQLPEFALLAVCGASRRFVATVVVGQGAVLGALGATLGVAGGAALAALALALVGGDLGGGYFADSAPTLTLTAAEVAAFAALGVAVGVAGSLAPALAARSIPPVRVLRAGAAAATASPRRAAVRAAVLALAGAALLAVPAIDGLPIAAYAAIAAWLFAAIAFVPIVTRAAGRAAHAAHAALAALASRTAWPALAHSPVGWLAIERVRGAPGASAAALAAVVASVALASAMAIMVHSFRDSVDRWLDAVLPADLYLRLPSPGADAPIPAAVQQRLRAHPAVARVEFLRTVELALDPTRPTVALLAREIERGRAARRLPMVGAELDAPAGTTPIYVSEAMVDLYRMRPGDRVSLALGHSTQGRFFVAGVWRDYARQHGAIALAIADYRALTGDASVASAAIWLADGSGPAGDGSTAATGAGATAATAAIRAALPELAGARFTAHDELRALSLRIFDRSFALTYALEAIAIVVGLFGVAATYAGESLARAREFGMLRHLGVTRGQISRMLAIESGILIACGVAWGVATGALIALVLVHRVNPQSFHWTMDLAWPVPILAATALSLAACGVAAAVLASRSASGVAPVRAVREDW